MERIAYIVGICREGRARALEIVAGVDGDGVPGRDLQRGDSVLPDPPGAGAEAMHSSGTAFSALGATLIARFQGFWGTTVSRFRGYELKIRGNGAWQIVASGPAAVTFASGSVTAARAYTLSLTARGTSISAQINGVLVAAVTGCTTIL